MTAGTDDLRQRRHLLLTMLTACAWRDTPAGPPPVVAGLRAFLGGLLGSGRIVVGMARQSYDLQLMRYGEEGWRATFYPAGRGHSVTSAVGSVWEEPWIAVQRTACGHLRRHKADEAACCPSSSNSPGGTPAKSSTPPPKQALAIRGNFATFHACTLA